MGKWPAVILIASLLSGCGLQQKGSHMISGAVGLKRQITLYSADGQVIRQWSGRYQVKVDGASARFMHSGKAITVSGTFVIEELK